MGLSLSPIDRTKRWTAQLSPVENLRAPISKCYIFWLQSFIVRPQGPTCHKKRGGTYLTLGTQIILLANWPRPSTIITPRYEEKKLLQFAKRQYYPALFQKIRAIFIGIYHANRKKPLKKNVNARWSVNELHFKRQRKEIVVYLRCSDSFLKNRSSKFL